MRDKARTRRSREALPLTQQNGDISYKIRRATLAVLLSICLCVPMVSEASATVSARLNKQAGTVYISGTVTGLDAGKKVNLLVLNPSNTFKMLDDGEVLLEDVLCRMDETVAFNDEGVVSFEFAPFQLSPQAAIGECEYRVSVGGRYVLTQSFYYTSLKKITESLNELNNAAQNQITDILEKNAAMLSLDTTDYLNLSSDGMDSVNNALHKQNYSAAENLTEAEIDLILSKLAAEFRFATALAIFNDAKEASEVQYAVEGYNDIYELDITFDSLFDKLNQANALKAKTALYKRLSEVSAVKDVPEIQDAFMTHLALTALQYCSWSDLHGIIERYNSTVFHFNLSGYSSLSSYSKDSVCKKMAGGEYLTVTSANTAFKNAINSLNSQGSGNDVGSSSSTARSSSLDSIRLETNAGEQAQETPAATDIFTDIQAVSWARESIEKLYQEGVIAGRGNGEFAPLDKVTRAEFVKMIVVAFAGSVEQAEINFTDVKEGDWYYEYIAKAQALSWVSGYPDGSFGAQNDITRQEIAALLYRIMCMYSRETDIQETRKFQDDEAIADYAKTAVASLRAAGIIAGTDDNQFLPTADATRAEAARMVAGLMSHIE